MNKNLTEVVFILDKSGSMHGLEADTIGGFNAMLDKQKKETGEARISTVLFSDHSTVIMDRIPVNQAEHLSEEDYTTGGCTAMLDAIGSSIHHIGNVHKYARSEDVPAHTVFIITTDGMENASRQYSLKRVRQMIEYQKKEYGWQFIFLGADIDAIETAEHLGIEREYAADFNNDNRGTALIYEGISDAVSSLRSRACLSSSWKRKIEKDYKARLRQH